jgi:hypothetical protein
VVIDLPRDIKDVLMGHSAVANAVIVIRIQQRREQFVRSAWQRRSRVSFPGP